MNKIPLLFLYDDNFRMTTKPNPACQWVFDGDGFAIEKLDGTNVRITTRCGTKVRVEQRRNPSKTEKRCGIVDPWYIDATDKWVLDAAACTDTTNWYDGEHCTEAIGPKIQGNPLGLPRRVCVAFNLGESPMLEVERTYLGLRSFLTSFNSRYAPGQLGEGIVFHHPDGRRAKIRRKDFK